MQMWNGRESLSRAVGRPRDIEAVDRLVHGSLILGALTLADLVDRRFRWLAYGAAGLIATSAFTGWTPAAAVLRLARMRSRSELEQDQHGLASEEGEAGERSGPFVRHEATDVSTSARGVPHRIPVEAFLGATREPRTFVDDLPAPSVDGDLGLAD